MNLKIYTMYKFVRITTVEGVIQLSHSFSANTLTFVYFRDIMKLSFIFPQKLKQANLNHRITNRVWKEILFLLAWL